MAIKIPNKNFFAKLVFSLRPLVLSGAVRSDIPLYPCSASAPVLDGTDGEAKWSLDDRKDWPLNYSGGEQPSYNYSVFVPPGSKVYSKMVKTEYGIHTVYEGRAILQTGKDRRWNFTITGEYSGKMSKVEERIGDED